MTLKWLAQALHTNYDLVEQWAYLANRKIKGRSYNYSYSDTVDIVLASNSPLIKETFDKAFTVHEDRSMFPECTERLKVEESQYDEERTIKFNKTYENYLFDHETTVRKRIMEGFAYHDEKGGYYAYRLDSIINAVKEAGLQFTRPEVEDRLRNFFCAEPVQFYIDKYDKAVRAWKQLSINLQ